MSVLNLNKNLIFIHVPKTAGSSMEMTGLIGGGGHQPIEYFKRMLELSTIGMPPYESFWKFAFVRNPYNRFASAVCSHYLENPSREEFTNFINSMRDTIENMRPPVLRGDMINVHLIPQHMFLCISSKEGKGLGWKEKIEMDFIGRFENLHDDWKKICNHVGEYVELPHHGSSGIKNYDYLYSDKTREIIFDLYKKDFDVFGYER